MATTMAVEPGIWQKIEKSLKKHSVKGGWGMHNLDGKSRQRWVWQEEHQMGASGEIKGGKGPQTVLYA